jgi:2-oxo-4-hydroxy-4-carboxy-5-ureidoimidazoline decarboxylase
MPRAVTLMTLDLLKSTCLAPVPAARDAFESGTRIAEATAGGRPCETGTDLHDAMMKVLEATPLDRRLAFVCGHPALGGQVTRKGADDLTDASRAERSGLGLDRLSDEEPTRFERLACRGT